MVIYHKILCFDVVTIKCETSIEILHKKDAVTQLKTNLDLNRRWRISVIHIRGYGF